MQLSSADDEMILEGGRKVERIITHLTCFFVSSGSVAFFFLKARSHGAMCDCVFFKNRNRSHMKWVYNLFKYDVAHHTQKCIAVTPSEHLQKPLHNPFHAIKLITVANKQKKTHRVNEP